MELIAATDFLGTSELLCDIMAEQPVEGEFTIPDYQPEIFKIVKTKAEPVVVQKLAVGSRATVDGYVRLSVIYQSDEDRRLFALTQKLPFSKQADLKEPVGDECAVFCDTSISYLNCRAVNSRRIDVRGAANIGIKVISGAGNEVVCDVTGEGAQQRRDNIDFMHQTGSDEKQFTIEEALAVDFEGSEFPAILRSDATAVTDSVTVEDDRLIVTGSVYVMMALDVSNEAEYRIKRAGFNLPFNQMIDMENTSETSQPVASVTVLSVTAEVEEDGIVGVSILCAVDVQTYEAGSASLISDAFSTRYELETVRETFSVTKSVDSVYQNVTIKQTVEKAAPGGKLIDYFITPTGIALDSAGDGSVKISAVFSYLLSDDMGDIQCWDEPFDFLLDIGVAYESPFSNLSVAFTALECAESGDAITFKAEGALHGSVIDTGRQTAIRSIVADTSSPKTAADMALAIYYADAGEDIFNIAKTFNTSPREIALENNVEDGVLEQKSMLLIPIVE